MKIRLIKTCEYGDKGYEFDPGAEVARLIIGRGLAEAVIEPEPAKAILVPPADKRFKGRGRVTK